ncbi:MAG: family 43 glycosylhydrolase [Ferruginibacter sp.]
MKFLSRLLLLNAAMYFSGMLCPLVAQERINAVIPGDFADPSIIRKGNQYYAVGTSSEWAPHLPIYQSNNLKDWKQTGFVFDKPPAWTSGSFWAPEYYFHNNTYFIYYTARRKKDKVSYIGVASSRYPDKDFKDHGVIIEYGKEAIDAFVFKDGKQLYITFKAYGLDKRPIEILASKLSPDGLKLQGELFTLIKDDKRIGLEGQSIIKKGSYYYLFYSAGNCCGSKCDYNVRFARSKSLQGPYENYSENPALQENGDWKCSGHGTMVTDPNGKNYYLYHAYNKISTVFTGRQGMLAELQWPKKNSWPVFQITPSKNKGQDVIDSFNTKAIANHWQWYFRNSTPVTKQRQGKFHLTGTFNPDNKTGIVLAVRPVALNFEATAFVINHNNSLKGLAYYGDANAATGIGCINDSIVLWVVKDNKRTELSSASITPAPVELKIKLMPDLACKFFYRQDNDNWKELGTDQKVTADFLPQWDRSPRIGLHFKGGSGGEAVFSSFQLSYL